MQLELVNNWGFTQKRERKMCICGIKKIGMYENFCY